MATVATVDICESGAAGAPYADSSYRDTTVILKDGVPVALVVPVKGTDPYLETYLTTHTTAFQEVMARIRKESAEGAAMSLEDFRKELDAEGLLDDAPRPARRTKKARSAS